MNAPRLPRTFNPNETDWIEHALCKGMDPNLFHPTRGTPQKQMNAIRTICDPCPVRHQCAETAIHDPSLTGFWGGLSERQRRAARRERGITAPHLLVSPAQRGDGRVAS